MILKSILRNKLWENKGWIIIYFWWRTVTSEIIHDLYSPFQHGDRLWTSKSTVYGRQTFEGGHRAQIIENIIIAVHP